MIHASHSDDAGSWNQSFNKFQAEQPNTSVLHDTSDVQIAINQQIWARLSDIGQRLTKLEKAGCKKSNDLRKIKDRSTHTHSKATPNVTAKSTESTGHSTVTSALSETENLPLNSPSVPSLADIRQNTHIQQNVDQIITYLHQLSNSGIDTKIKSL